jgi:hypothetical protein
LAVIFEGYDILSSKILRDHLGNSRGVGFARYVNLCTFALLYMNWMLICPLSFESRDVCDEIIEKFVGMKLGEEAQPLQIRYADTPAQKELKRITAERRQFRTNEYNVGAYGTPLVGMNPTIYNQPSYRRALSGPGYV